MTENNVKKFYKICLLGDSGVGKTAIAERYVNNKFDVDSICTIGASFLTKKIQNDNTQLNLEIWDTAGQERYRALTPLYYRQCSAVIIVIDNTENLSIESAEYWIKRVNEENEKPYIILVINKTDLNQDINEINIENFCNSYSVDYIYVSAKTNANIDNLFNRIITNIYSNPIKRSIKLEEYEINSKPKCCK